MSNVRVCVRVRPLNSKEIAHDGDGGCEVVSVDENRGSVRLQLDEKDVDGRCESGRAGQGKGGRKFHFDEVFGTQTTQESFYERVAKPAIKELVKGFNVTIFAYGQTGSGKSFSTFGAKDGATKRWADAPLRGVVPRALIDIFDAIAQLQDTAAQVEVKVSFMELYCEVIRDLLAAPDTRIAGPGGLKIREPPGGDLYVEGLAEEYVQSADDAMALLERGEGNRTTAATNMNATSSRSHCVFQVSLRQSMLDGTTVRSRVYFVDLAGSEAIKKTEATGDRLEEAKKINLSLTTLARCINALTDRRPTHPPFRDSQLTRLLKPALGGNSKTSVIIACSPSRYNTYETLSTLRFAERAKHVVNKSVQNVELTYDQLKVLCETLKKDLERMTTLYTLLRDTGVEQGGLGSSASATAKDGQNKLGGNTLEDRWTNRGRHSRRIGNGDDTADDNSGENDYRSDSEGSELSNDDYQGNYSEDEEDDAVENKSTKRGTWWKRGSRAKGPSGGRKGDDRVDSTSTTSSAQGELVRVAVAGYLKTIQEQDDEIASLKEELEAKEEEMTGVRTSAAVAQFRRAHTAVAVGGGDARAVVSAKRGLQAELLGEVPCFGALVRPDRLTLARMLVQISLKRGQRVDVTAIENDGTAAEGKYGCLYLVERGSVRMGKRTLSAGDFFGDVSWIDVASGGISGGIVDGLSWGGAGRVSGMTAVSEDGPRDGDSGGGRMVAGGVDEVFEATTNEASEEYVVVESPTCLLLCLEQPPESDREAAAATALAVRDARHLKRYERIFQGELTLATVLDATPQALAAFVHQNSRQTAIPGQGIIAAAVTSDMSRDALLQAALECFSRRVSDEEIRTDQTRASLVRERAISARLAKEKWQLQQQANTTQQQSMAYQGSGAGGAVQEAKETRSEEGIVVPSLSSLAPTNGPFVAAGSSARGGLMVHGGGMGSDGGGSMVTTPRTTTMLRKEGSLKPRSFGSFSSKAPTGTTGATLKRSGTLPLQSPRSGGTLSAGAPRTPRGNLSTGVPASVRRSSRASGGGDVTGTTASGKSSAPLRKAATFSGKSSSNNTRTATKPSTGRAGGAVGGAGARARVLPPRE